MASFDLRNFFESRQFHQRMLFMVNEDISHDLKEYIVRGTSVNAIILPDEYSRLDIAETIFFLESTLTLQLMYVIILTEKRYANFFRRLGFGFFSIKGHELDYDDVDLVFDDFAIARDNITKDTRMCYNLQRFSLNQLSLLSANRKEAFSVGGFVRRATYSALKINKVDTFWGLGDRARNVLDGHDSGIHIKAINVEKTPSLTFGCTVTAARNNHKLASSGQEKLYIADLYMLRKYSPQIYIAVGTYEGFHFQKLAHCYSNVLFVLIDPKGVAFDHTSFQNIIVIKELFSIDLISDKIKGSIFHFDIRGDLNNMTEDQWEMGIIKDTLVMLEWSRELLDKGALSCMIKIRPAYPNEETYITTDSLTYEDAVSAVIKKQSTMLVPDSQAIFLPQAYQSLGSYEFRLVIDVKFKDIKQSTDIEVNRVKDWIRYTNAIRANMGNSHLAESIISETILFGDYLKVKFEADLAIGMFSVSSAINGRRAFYKLLKYYKSGIATFPIGNISHSLFHTKNDILYYRQYTDLIYDGNDLVEMCRKRRDHVRWYTLRDYITYCYYTEDGIRYNSNDESWPVNLNSKEFYLWGVLVWGDIPFIPVVTVQSWLNSQTHLVKLVSTRLRMEFSLDDHSLHYARQIALEAFFMSPSGQRDPNLKLLDDTRVSGIYSSKHRVQVFAVAGHMVNMLMAASLGLVDMHRYMDTIEDNVRRYAENDFEKINIMARKGLLAEDNNVTYNHLWHSFTDFYCAVFAYLILCKKFNIRVAAFAVLIALRRLKLIRMKYRQFDDNSWIAVLRLKEMRQGGLLKSKFL